MTTVVYEACKGRGGRAVAHVTRDQKKTICGKQVKLLSESGPPFTEKYGHCGRCWRDFS